MIPEGGARFIRKICIECWRHPGKDLLVGAHKPNQAQPYGTQTVMPGARFAMIECSFITSSAPLESTLHACW